MVWDHVWGLLSFGIEIDVNRRHGYAARYPHQFTIRAKLPTGAETELSKIVNGHGDWMFYGYA